MIANVNLSDWERAKLILWARRRGVMPSDDWSEEDCHHALMLFLSTGLAMVAGETRADSVASRLQEQHGEPHVSGD